MNGYFEDPIYTQKRSNTMPDAPGFRTVALQPPKKPAMR